MDSSILEFGHVPQCKQGLQSNISNRMANTVDSDETAPYEPSDLNLHRLHKYLVLVCRDENVVTLRPWKGDNESSSSSRIQTWDLVI